MALVMPGPVSRRRYSKLADTEASTTQTEPTKLLKFDTSDEIAPQPIVRTLPFRFWKLRRLVVLKIPSRFCTRTHRSVWFLLYIIELDLGKV